MRNGAIVSGMGHVRRIAFLLGLAIGGATHAGSPEPAPTPVPPAAKPAPLVPHVQKDDYSCGFLALAAIYESYGIDPRMARLRDRLGTDVPAVAFVKDSNGTLQPDLLRVLKQDGFGAAIVNAEDAAGMKSLRDHLQGGQYALALTRTEQAGGLHWVALTGYKDGDVTVGDSLKLGLQRENLVDYAAGPLLRAILLTPGTPDPRAAYGYDHARGLSDMAATAWRTARIPFIASVLFLILVVFCLWYLVRKRGKKRRQKRNELQA